MKSFLLAAAALLGYTRAVSAVACSAEQRINIMRYITAAFNEHDLALSAEAIQGMPLQADCPAIVSLEGSPGIEFGIDAATTKDFAQIVRQVFSNVVSVYTDYDNGTTLMDADVTLGVLGFVDLPVHAHVLVPAQFNLSTCLLSELVANIYVPSSVAGIPVDPPTLPVIPGLTTLPGLSNVLKKLDIPGNPYDL